MPLFPALLLLQAIPGGGGGISPGAAPGLPEMPLRDSRDVRKHGDDSPDAVPLAETSQLHDCVAAVDADAAAGETRARLWLDRVKGTSAEAEPDLCLGEALSQQGDWTGAEAAFTAGRTIAAASDYHLRARLAAMAGNAALAHATAGADELTSTEPASATYARALTALDAAKADAAKSGDKPLLAVIAADRARALVALHREGDAAASLAEARALTPDDANVWLLSATLSRRQGKLAEAQGEIEAAAKLRPVDPEIGLEAGVIAVLSGREASARKSWSSVIAAAPKSPAAEIARGYIAQLGPASADHGPPPAASVTAPVPAGTTTRGADSGR